GGGGAAAGPPRPRGRRAWAPLTSGAPGPSPRRCRHCYEPRFRPYTGDALQAVVAEAERNFPRIVDNLPERLTYLDLDDPGTDGSFPEKPGRIILSGGE